MKLSVELSALTDKFGDYKAAELAKEAGFDAVDYSYYWDNEKKEVLGDNYREYAEKLRAHFDKIGIECNQAHAPFSFSYSNAMDASDERYLWILHSIESAAILGAKNIIIHAVSVPDGVDLEEYNIAYYKSFIPYCEKFGINVSVENLFTHAPNGCLIGKLGSPEELNRIVEKINSPWVNACVDIGHAALTGYKPENFIRNMNPSILKAVHIHDNDFIADRHTLPFTGEFGWEEIITALSVVGYDGDLTFEIFNYLRKIPCELISEALKFAVSVGRYIISKIEKHRRKKMRSNIKEYIDTTLEKCTRYTPKDDGALIGLPYSYTVPSAESFNELYYWDTYFTNIGLLRIGKAELAKNNTDNMLYLVNKYGFMPNGSRTYYLNRSQPPFLSQMVKEIYDYYKDGAWLTGAYPILKKEYDFWSCKRNSPVGLNHYDSDYTPELIEEFRKGFIQRVGEVSSDVDTDIGRHSLATAESGWDMNPRFEFEAYNYGAIDLNSLLYGFEKNMESFATILENGEADIWSERAKARLDKMNAHMINNDGLFADYNFAKDKCSPIFSAASYFTMFTKAATKEQAELLVKNLGRIEDKYGISTCEKSEHEGISYQWDYPNGWACLQYIVIKGLENYGYIEEAKRIAEKYVSLVESVFEKTGNFWEKYNVADGDLNVNNEYGLPTMLGWSAGVYIYADEMLNTAQ